MKHFIAAGLAVLTMAAAVAPTATAFAQDGRHNDQNGYRHDGDRRDNNGNAVAAGIAGLAVGAALANRGEYRGGYYYGQPQYAYDYYYGPNYSGARHCHSSRYWDRDNHGYGQRTRCRR